MEGDLSYMPWSSRKADTIFMGVFRSQFFFKKILHQIFEYMHEVLNEIYLQFFLHGWIVNREMNLISLLNS